MDPVDARLAAGTATTPEQNMLSTISNQMVSIYKGGLSASVPRRS